MVNFIDGRIYGPQLIFTVNKELGSLGEAPSSNCKEILQKQIGFRQIDIVFSSLNSLSW